MQAHAVVLGDLVVGHPGQVQEGVQPGGRGRLGHLVKDDSQVQEPELGVSYALVRSKRSPIQEYYEP